MGAALVSWVWPRSVSAFGAVSSPSDHLPRHVLASVVGDGLSRERPQLAGELGDESEALVDGGGVTIVGQRLFAEAQDAAGQGGASASELARLFTGVHDYGAPSGASSYVSPSAPPRTIHT